jgi:predicted nucleic acid-binding protein
MVMTDAKAPIFIDTNILIRFTLASAPLHLETGQAVTSLWNNDVEIWINRQVLREYANVLTRPQTYATPLSAVAVANELRILQSRFRVADENADVTAKLITLLETVLIGGKQVHDANIVATMQVYGIGRLLTLNTADFVRFSRYITVLSLEDIK